jgi:hypothetical protein
MTMPLLSAAQFHSKIGSEGLAIPSNDLIMTADNWVQHTRHLGGADRLIAPALIKRMHAQPLCPGLFSTFHTQIAGVPANRQSSFLYCSAAASSGKHMVAPMHGKVREHARPHSQGLQAGTNGGFVCLGPVRVGAFVVTLPLCRRSYWFGVGAPAALCQTAPLRH